MYAIHPKAMEKIRRLLDLPDDAPVTLEHLARAYEIECAQTRPIPPARPATQEDPR